MNFGVPCIDCGALYGTKHAPDCKSKIKYMDMFKMALERGELKIMKKPENLEWPEGPKDRAMRFNAGKPEMSYITDFPNAVEGLARIMEFGAQKYERNNWKKGLEINDYIDCFMRHVTDYKRGIEFDKETGLHQFFHMAVNAMMLAEVHGKFQIVSDHDDAADADAFSAMVAATIAGHTGRRPVDAASVARRGGPGPTVAGTVPTAEDEPPLEPTPLLFDKLTEADVEIVAKKAEELAAAIGTHTMDVINEYAMMFFDDPEKRLEFIAECRRKVQKNRVTINPSAKSGDEIGPLGR